MSRIKFTPEITSPNTIPRYASIFFPSTEGVVVIIMILSSQNKNFFEISTVSIAYPQGKSKDVLTPPAVFPAFPYTGQDILQHQHGVQLIVAVFCLQVVQKRRDFPGIGGCIYLRLVPGKDGVFLAPGLGPVN